MNTPTQTQMAEVGAMLRAMREGVGISQSEMADMVGKSKATLSRFENGTRVISAELLSKIAAVVAAELAKSDKRRRAAA
jgi:transcriptional regulator with XRE-family HTH domain